MCALSTACGDEAAIGGPAVELGDSYLLISNASFDFQSGSLAAIETPGLEAHGDLSFLHPDSVVRVSAGRLFAINRLAADNVQRLDPTTLLTRWQYSVGAGSNPQDVLVLEDGRAYVTRYEETDLWVVDTEASTAEAFRIDAIDLGAFADADGVPEMSLMTRLEDRVWVALQRLDRSAGFLPTNDGLLIAIGTDDDAIVDLDPTTPGPDGLTTPTANPLALATWGTEIWVGCVGFFGQLDGAIERYDTETERWLAPVVTERALGGDLSAFVPGDPLVVLWSDDQFEGHASLIDVTTGEERRLADGLSSVQDLAADESRVYLLDRHRQRPGVRVFDRATGQELTAAPIPTGLPPWSIEIVDRTGW